MRRSNIIKPRDRSNYRGNNSSHRSAFSRDTRGDRKRKFPDPRSHHMQNVRPNVCSEQREPVQDSRSEGAKTSEFAYFKKIKKEAAQSELHSRDREKNRFKDVESNHYERDNTVKLKQIFNEPKSSVPIGTERSGDHPCLTPPICAPKSSEINMVETSDKDILFPLLNEKVTTPSNRNHWPSFSRSYPNNTGVQYCDKGIFGLKRRKLCQWVSGTLHQEIDDLSSEGFSLVSMLLNRLFPEDNKENRDWEPKYSQAEISAQDQLPWIPNDDDNTQHSRGHYGTLKNHLMESEDAAYEDYYFTQNFSERSRDVVLPELENGGGDSPLTTYPVKTSSCINVKPYHKIDASITENFFPESNSARNQLPLFPHDNINSRGHYRKHTNHLVEFENAGCQDYGFTRYLSERHGDVILPDLDNVDADFPSTTYPVKTYFPCTYVKPNSYIDASFTEGLFQESNSCFQLQPKKHGSIAIVDHYSKNFDKCDDTNGSLLQGEPYALLLGWNYSNEEDEQGLSISSYNRNVNLSAQSGDNDHWLSHDRQDESSLSSSSLVSSYFLNCNSLAQPSSANFCSTRDSGRYFEYENYLYAKLDHFPVPFSCNPDSLKYLCGPSEDSSTNNQSETRNVVFSTQDHFWNPNNFHDQESLFLSTSLDRELGEKHLLISDYSTENQLSMVHAYQSPQHVGPSACFGEEDKECFLYDPRFTSDYAYSLNFQDLSALNIRRSRDTRVSIQRHSTSWGFPKLERYHTEVDEDSECEFE